MNAPEPTSANINSFEDPAGFYAALISDSKEYEKDVKDPEESIHPLDFAKLTADELIEFRAKHKEEAISCLERVIKEYGLFIDSAITEKDVGKLFSEVFKEKESIEKLTTENLLTAALMFYYEQLA